MRSGGHAKPRLAASPPSAHGDVLKGVQSGSRLHDRSGNRLAQRRATIFSQSYAISTAELSSEILTLACAGEIFREDLSERAQARKFMWEFFD